MARKPQMSPDQMRLLAKAIERDNPGTTARATANGRHVITIRQPDAAWIAVAKARAAETKSGAA